MFKRELSILKQVQLNKRYGELINKDNIETISRVQIFLIFRSASKMEKSSFLHNVVDAWWKDKEEDYKTLSKLKRIIKKTGIVLNVLEKERLLFVEERVFSEDRHIKDIGVNIKLSKKEQVGIKYTDAKLFEEIGEKLQNKKIGDLMVSNRRIIFSGKTTESFNFKDIDAFICETYGFKFLYEGFWYVLRIHDQRTLNITMMNLIGKKNKTLLRKGGENEWNKKTFL